MKSILSLALALGQVLAAVPAGAQQAGALSGGVSCSASTTGDGPIAGAALREASRVPLRTTAAQQEQQASGRDQAAVSALRERARQIPLGKKVKVVTVSGEKVEGTLRGAGETSVLIEKRPEPSPPTRYDIHGNKMPTPPTAPAIPPTTVEVSYDTMQSIKKPMGTGAKSAIFLGVLFGGLAILGLASADLGNAS